MDAEKELAREQGRASSLETALGVSKQDLSKLQDEKTSLLAKVLLSSVPVIAIYVHVCKICPTVVPIKVLWLRYSAKVLLDPDACA